MRYVFMLPKEPLKPYSTFIIKREKQRTNNNIFQECLAGEAGFLFIRNKKIFRKQRTNNNIFQECRAGKFGFIIFLFIWNKKIFRMQRTGKSRRPVYFAFMARNANVPDKKALSQPPFITALR